MMRLIDADALYDKAEEKYKGAYGFYRPIYKGFIDDVADAPTVDAVPVVRCKDCNHFRLCGGNTVNSSYNWCAHFREYTTGEDFCSRGEKAPQ